MTLEPGTLEDMPERPEPNGQSVAGAMAPLPPPSREYRAMVTFTVAGAFLVVALFLFAGVLSFAPVALASVALGTVALLMTAYGLSGRQPWAIAVMSPILWLLVILGAIEFVGAFTHNAINIPIGGILALWALRAPTHGTAGPLGATGTFVIVAIVLSSVLPLLGPAF